jgi:hypothetical protein
MDASVKLQRGLLFLGVDSSSLLLRFLDAKDGVFICSELMATPGLRRCDKYPAEERDL